MNDIFISYKREEHPEARKLADALEKEGWNVWWDPKLRAGEHFDDIIEKALKDSKCVVVMWSKLSVNSRYVKDEATYALNRNKLVPVKIEEAELPFRFEGLHTPLLIGWDGSREFPDFRRLVDDISVIVKPSEVARQRPRPSKRRLHSAAQSVKKAPTAGTVFRDRVKDGSQGPEMVLVPAGTFKMGDIQGKGDDFEKPVHSVSIPKPFAMGRYQITFEEYDRFASATSRPLPNDRGWGRGRQPVINVSWEDAVEYSKWLSEQTDKQYRLPTESEWEYAARAGTETAYWWGNEITPGMANFAGTDNSWDGKQTSPVGSFKPNPFGLYDTAGNVWESVQDSWHENYKGAPTDGSAWEEMDDGQRVIRGGSWGSRPGTLRSSNRGRGNAGSGSGRLGFRLAQDLE
jgi:formylglycine-generating enzyme required for sulfatase activity